MEKGYFLILSLQKIDVRSTVNRMAPTLKVIEVDQYTSNGKRLKSRNINKTASFILDTSSAACRCNSLYPARKEKKKNRKKKKVNRASTLRGALGPGSIIPAERRAGLRQEGATFHKRNQEPSPHHRGGGGGARSVVARIM